MRSSQKGLFFMLFSKAKSLSPAHTRIALAGGVFIGFLLQDLAAWLYPAFPFLIATLLLLAFVQIPAQEWFVRPSPALLQSLVWALFVVPLIVLLTPLPAWVSLILLTVVCAPSVASASNLALITQLDAAYALRFTLISSLLAPISALCFFSSQLSLDWVQAAGFLLRLYAIIGGAFMIAALLQKRFSQPQIQAQKAPLNLAAVFTLTLFAIAIMHGSREAALSDPWRCLGILLLAFAVNFGLQFVTYALTRWGTKRSSVACWTDALLHGNRNVALIYAFLPAQPELALFIAFYQIPMYLTPLAINALRQPR